ncbi:synaptotagmin-1-like [Apteryx mantelli]|uniref:Synaptotagmin-1-like n=1 Tax=Apteryx mantelli TaxID=2696672 RepID=A0ABM4EFI9_9AVES
MLQCPWLTAARKHPHPDGSIRKPIPNQKKGEEAMIQKNSTVTDLYNLWLSFANACKYGILALAILLLLVALTILACQMRQLQKHNRTGKKKKHHSEGCVRAKAEKGTWGEKTPPFLLDITKRNNAGIKIQKLRAELDKPSACLPFSPTRTENLNGANSDLDFLHSSRGKLKSSLLYCREQRELLLTGLEARDLPSQGRAKSSVCIRLLRQVPSHIPGLQCMVHEWQSQVVKNCSRPAFGDKFVCSLRDTEVEKSTLKLEDVVGEVLVSLKCLPISQRIEVGLLKAKTAPPCSTANKTLAEKCYRIKPQVQLAQCPSLRVDKVEKNVYARIDVSCRRHRQKPQKSRLRAHTSLIVFNETFLFHMSESSAWDCTVLVSIYEVDSDPRCLIGQATLRNSRPSNAADHWDLVMKSVQQPVAKWHPLLI